MNGNYIEWFYRNWIGSLKLANTHKIYRHAKCLNPPAAKNLIFRDLLFMSPQNIFGSGRIYIKYFIENSVSLPLHFGHQDIFDIGVN